MFLLRERIQWKEESKVYPIEKSIQRFASCLYMFVGEKEKQQHVPQRYQSGRAFGEQRKHRARNEHVASSKLLTIYWHAHRAGSPDQSGKQRSMNTRELVTTYPKEVGYGGMRSTSVDYLEGEKWCLLQPKTHNWADWLNICCLYMDWQMEYSAETGHKRDGGGRKQFNQKGGKWNL